MEGDGSYIILLHPDFEKLKDEVEKLRTELSMLVLEQDHLIYQECKNIEMAYLLALGALEYKAYELECAILRLKRKIELIQAQKNRQEEVVLSKIETILDFEFTEYEEKLNEQVGKMNEAFERSHLKMMTEDEADELKKLYRTIVKALHPDLNPGQTEERLELFRNAVEAYEHGDLNGLRVIDAMVGNPVLTDNKSDGLAVLIKEKERLTILIQTIKDRISDIKSEYPYTMKALVQDPNKIAERKAELEEYIEQLNDAIAAYAAKIEEILR